MQARSRAPLAFAMPGLALLELLVAGCVLALLVSLAAPNFASISERMKLRSAVEALASGIYVARAEAYKRGGHVTFAAADAAKCSLGQNASPWSCGWIVFADENDDGRHDAIEEVIFVGQVPDGIHVVETKGTSAFRLNAWGRFNGLSAFGFALTSRVDRTAGSVVCISAGGRVRTEHGQSEC